MKEQYVGDVNDYRKYALLRHLAKAGGIRVGVCWMLTSPDAGNLRQYLAQPERWLAYDPELFRQLRGIIEEEEVNRLAAIESSGILPGARFFNRLLTENKGERADYFKAALTHLAETDLVFFDPDNGIAPAKAREQPRRSSKFIYADEISTAYADHHSVLIYQHFPRVPRDQFIKELGADLAERAPTAQRWCFRTPFAAFLLLIHPHHSASLVAAAESTPKHWRSGFIDGRQLTGE